MAIVCGVPNLRIFTVVSVSVLIDFGSLALMS